MGPRPTSMEVSVVVTVAGEATVHAIVAQEVRVGLHRAEVVDRHHLDIGAPVFDDGAQDVAADASEPVDCNFDSHVPSEL